MNRADKGAPTAETHSRQSQHHIQQLLRETLTLAQQAAEAHEVVIEAPQWSQPPPPPPQHQPRYPAAATAATAAAEAAAEEEKGEPGPPGRCHRPGGGSTREPWGQGAARRRADTHCQSQKHPRSTHTVPGPGRGTPSSTSSECAGGMASRTLG